MSTAATGATPLLTAFRGRRAAHGPGSMQAGNFFADFVTLLGCLIPVAICLYLGDDKPLFAIKSVEFTQQDLVCGILVVAVLLRATLVGFHKVPKLLYVPVFLFLGSTLLSSLFATDKLRGVAAIIQILEFFLVAWSFALITDERRFLRIVHFTLGVFAFETLVAVTQLVTREGYPTGTFKVHQVFAMMVSVCAVMAFTLWMTTKAGRLRLLYGILTAFFVVGSLIGQERAPWLALVVAGLVIVSYSSQRKAVLVWLFAMLLLAGSVVAVVPKLREMTVSRFAEAQSSTESQNSLLSRLLLWSIAYKFFVANPVLGVGPKNYVSLVPHYATSEEMMGEEALDPHNAWIGVAAEQGLIGLATYLLLTWGLLKLAGMRLRAQMSERGRSLAFVYLAYLVYWIVMAYPFFMKSMGHIHFMMIGLMAAMYQRYASEVETSPAESSRVAGTQSA